MDLNYEGCAFDGGDCCSEEANCERCNLEGCMCHETGQMAACSSNKLYISSVWIYYQRILFVYLGNTLGYNRWMKRNGKLIWYSSENLPYHDATMLCRNLTINSRLFEPREEPVVTARQAILDCARHGGSLFAPQSKGENDAVRNAAIQANPGYSSGYSHDNNNRWFQGFWMGLTDIGHEGRQVLIEPTLCLSC